MTSIISYAPLLMKGAAMTIAAWALASLISLTIGFLVGIISCKHLTLTYVIWIVRLYTFIAKGIPAYVQILIAYFVIPALTGINIPGFLATTCALGFCSSGYVTEIVRTGINGISRGQWEACVVLGYPLRLTLTRIILPQTLQRILPTLIGELEQLIKSTSLLATIGVTELTRSGMNIISRELNPIPIYITIATVYLLFAAILQSIILYTEKGAYYDNR